MKFKSIIFFIILLITFGCAPSLLFTEQQFNGVVSDASIPEKWHGEWFEEDANNNHWIARDSFSIGGLDYKIIQSQMDFGLDSLNGTDKLIFKDNWCYLSRYIDNAKDSTTSFFSGYQVLVASIDSKDNINCWEMTYDYFLKNRYVNQIPTIKFFTTNIASDGVSQQIEPRIVYAEIPRELNKHEYNRLIKKTSIITDASMLPFNSEPYFCYESYDLDFFKNIAMSRTPDIILTNTKKVVRRKLNNNERKYRKISEKNFKKKYFKFVYE